MNPKVEKFPFLDVIPPSICAAAGLGASIIENWGIRPRIRP